MAPVNRAGPAMLRDLPPPVSMSPDSPEAAVAWGATVVDGRDRESFARAHVPGSLNIELDEQFCSYVGWLVPWNTPLVLVLADTPGALGEAVTQLRRIGFDGAIGHLAGAIEAWYASGRPVASYPTSTTSGLESAISAGGDLRVLDVRQPGEWADGVIPESRTIFVGDLPARVGEVPHDHETWVVCRTGHRAAIAASILDAAGVPVRLVAEGGVPDVLAATGRRATVDGAAAGRAT
jgi:rhodanese-related sulfurtransferase